VKLTKFKKRLFLNGSGSSRLRIFAKIVAIQQPLIFLQRMDNDHVHHKCTGVHIFGDAKNICPNLILLSQITYEQQVIMLRLKRSIVN